MYSSSASAGPLSYREVVALANCLEADGLYLIISQQNALNVVHYIDWAARTISSADDQNAYSLDFLLGTAVYETDEREQGRVGRGRNSYTNSYIWRLLRRAAHLFNALEEHPLHALDTGPP